MVSYAACVLYARRLWRESSRASGRPSPGMPATQRFSKGRLEPGRHLKEKELAKETGSSRTSVRETSQVLQAEGPVELLPNRGATVRICRLDEIETSLIARLKEKR